MLEAFEYWFGPYPFIEDGFKLVESSHLGMEHQSAIAYGNGFANGYRGRDFSGSGWGKDWDFIIIHESGHEWFANNITTKDIADMWIHEGFTKYSEVLFVEYFYGRKAADEYSMATRKSIRNDKPITGDYGVNQEGSGDMYNKGSGLIHHIREIINNDSLFRLILRGLNKDFYHQTTTSKDIENYISKKSGLNLAPVFNQYLLTTQIPVLEYELKNDRIRARFVNCREDFSMPVRFDKKGNHTPIVSTAWQEFSLPAGLGISQLSSNYYWELKAVK
jgi:aminopeptidase N